MSTSTTPPESTARWTLGDDWTRAQYDASSNQQKYRMLRSREAIRQAEEEQPEEEQPDPLQLVRGCRAGLLASLACWAVSAAAGAAACYVWIR